MSRHLPRPIDDPSRWCEHAGFVRALAQKLVRDADVAEDVAQEAFLRALRGPGPAPGRFHAWIATVVHNIVASQRRRDRRRLLHEPQATPPATGEDPRAAMLSLEAHEQLVAAVRALDEPYRTTVILRWFEGLSPRAIAARTETPVRTVHTRLQRAMAQLRTRLCGRDTRWPALLLTPILTGRSAAAVLAMTTTTKLTVGAGLCAAALAVFAWRTTNAPPSAPPADPTGAHVAPAIAAAEPRTALPSEREAAVVPTAEVADALPEPPGDPWPLRGIVVDVDGRPIAGVGVAFVEFFTEQAKVRAETALDGRFELTLADVTGGNVEVDDDAWTAVYRPVLWGNRDVGELTIVAAPATPVTGTVTDTAGRALPAVMVSLSGTPPPRARFGRSLERARDGEWQTTSDERGAFTLARAPVLPGMRISASKSGYRSWHGDLTQRSALHLELERGAVLVGRVVDADGKPVEASVFLSPCAAMSGPDGRFEIDITGASSPWLVAARAGNLPARLRCPSEQSNVPESWPQPLELQLGGPPLSIQGRALFADGTPIPSPSVRLLDPECLSPGDEMSSIEFLARVHSRVTDNGTEFSEDGVDHAPGAFSLSGLQDRDYRLILDSASTLQSTTTDPIRAGTHDVEVRLPAEPMWPSLAGVVIDRRGAPVEGADLWFDRRDPGGAVRTSEHLRTGADGRFARGPLARPGVTALVQTPGIAHPSRFELDAAGDANALRLVAPVKTTVRIDATPASAAADSASFLDADGNCVAATVTQGDRAWGAFDVALTDGRSEVVTVPDNAVTLVLKKRGQELSRHRVDLEPGDLRVLWP